MAGSIVARPALARDPQRDQRDKQEVLELLGRGPLRLDDVSRHMQDPGRAHDVLRRLRDAGQVHTDSGYWVAGSRKR